MKYSITGCLVAVFIIVQPVVVKAQLSTDDSVRFDYRKIYSLCLDGNVRDALPLLLHDSTKKIAAKMLMIKTSLEDRFKYSEDRSNYMEERRSGIDSLLTIYQGYWRNSLLNPDSNYDQRLIVSLCRFFNKQYPSTNNSSCNEDNLDVYIGKYIRQNGLHATGFGKTGKFYDLLVWRAEKDTVYSFVMGGEKLTPRVVFMDNFITLGWEEYATIGRSYPGGWTKPDGLYCVTKAYDLNSESFLISYLAHEGRHFADTKLFPKLSSPDLEYRAKLVELSLADKTLYDLIEFFIVNANHDSKNGHSMADYCVIRNLSNIIFKEEFEKDRGKWEKIGKERINKEAFDLLEMNTKALKSKGKKVERYIK